jgi:phospholipid/cholesterol/gamma-HCH transport system substrate-binding protein
VEALDRVNRIFSDENIKTLSATLSDVQSVTAELRERKSIIADAQKVMQDADETTKQITALAKSSQGLVDGDGRRTLVKLADAATEIEGASKALKVTLNKLEGPTESFATTGLPQLTQTIESLQRATDHLDQVLGEVQANPRGLIGKAPAKQIEVKP